MQNKQRQKNTSVFEKITEDFRIDVQSQIENFLCKDLCNSLEFPSNLSSIERAYIHEYIKPLGLTSKSHGQNDKRKLTIYKRVVNTNTEFKELHLSEKSRRHLQEFLQKGSMFNNLEVAADKESEARTIPLVSSKSNGNLVGNQLDEKMIPQRPKRNEFWRETQNLPIHGYRDIILQTLNNHSVVIVSGETGSGKTTQVPQFILNEYSRTNRPCRILCTQTRRLATTSVAERVAQERGESLGHTVGFQIRLEGCSNKSTNLIFTTSGCVLRCLMSNKHEIFRNTTHLIIDEIHERDKNTDFMLISVKEQLKHDKHLKVILMSATMDIKLLQSYFGNCPVIQVPGQSYSIKMYYLEDILFHTGYRTKMMNTFYNEIKSEGLVSTSLKSKEDEDLIWLDQHTRSTVDDTINECLKGPEYLDDNLNQLIYLIDGEGIHVDVSESKNGKTGLMISIMYSRFDFIQKFIELGADVNKKDCFGKSSLDYARQNNIEQYIISTSSKPNDQTLVHDINEKQYLLSAYQKQFNDDESVDHDLILAMISGLHSNSGPGAIMVFLPGYSDIVELTDLITSSFTPGSYKLFILHSQMNSSDQKAALRTYKERKLILSTNIGQTSITIPDLVYVLDTGKIKMKMYDSITGSSMLRSVWVSKACANQRSGRAGRTQNGVCYRLFSKRKYDSMSTFCIPEFVRIPLTEICLYAKTLDNQTPVDTYLSKALIPPSSVSLNNAVQKLMILEVFDENENVTDLGKHLASIPLDVQLGKILLYSIFLNCLDPILTIVAYHSMKEPFLLPKDRGQQLEAYKKRKQFAGDSFSDHMGILNLYAQFLNTQNNPRLLQGLCNRNFLSKTNLEIFQQTRSQIYQSIRQIYNMPKGQCNKNSNNWYIIQMCLVAGLYPNVAMVDYENTKLVSQTEKKLGIHQSSVLHTKNTKYQFKNTFEVLRDWVVFFEKSRLSSIGIINYNTLIPSIIIALICGKMSCHFETNQPAGANDIFLLQIDDWIQFITTYQDNIIFCQVRQKLRNFFLYFLRSGFKAAPNQEFIEFVDTLKTLFWIEIDREIQDRRDEIPPQFMYRNIQNGNNRHNSKNSRFFNNHGNTSHHQSLASNRC